MKNFKNFTQPTCTPEASEGRPRCLTDISLTWIYYQADLPTIFCFSLFCSTCFRLTQVLTDSLLPLQVWGPQHLKALSHSHPRKSLLSIFTKQPWVNLFCIACPIHLDFHVTKTFAVYSSGVIFLTCSYGFSMNHG